MPAGVVDRKQQTGGRVTPADAVEPESRHRQALEHFLGCAAIGRFPDDDWVRRTALALRPVLKLYEDRPITDLAGAVATLARKLTR